MKDLDEIRGLLFEGEALIMPRKGYVRVVDVRDKNVVLDFSLANVVYFLEQRRKNSLKKDTDGR